MAPDHRYPVLHNAMWPGLVGKGGPDGEPPLDLDTMLNLTAAARVNGTRFDGVDLFLFDPHVSIDSSDDDLKRLADKIGSMDLVVGSDDSALDEGLKTMTSALRPWTIDFHVAQNDATVKGSGSHDKTGRHCLPFDPNGKLDIVRHAAFWLRDENGQLERRFTHVCWDGCMFPNAVMTEQQTWNDVLGVMKGVRDAHGWL